MNWTWYLFGFNGRINRAKNWLAGLIILSLMIIFVVLVVYLSVMINFAVHAMGIAHGSSEISFIFDLDDIYSVLDPAAWQALSFAKLPIVLVKAIGLVLFLWIFLATSIKRLHDRDKSGWWMVAFFAVPNIYNHYLDLLPDSYVMLIPSVITFVLMIWGVVELYFLRGSRKTNRFGPNPLLAIEIKPNWAQQGFRRAAST
jgi:uncharacterized membrane protein YhaH (DUF805 family)